MRRFHRHVRRLLLAGGAAGAFGCSTAKTLLDERLPPPGRSGAVAPRNSPSLSGPSAGSVVQASAEVPADPQVAQPLSRVDEFVGFAVAQNPRIGRATIAIDAAQGRFVQAGLYPNPELAAGYDEIGDRTGPGILSVPRLTQTIVTGKKLKLSQAVAAREVDQAALGLLGERYAVAAAVRACAGLVGRSRRTSQPWGAYPADPSGRGIGSRPSGRGFVLMTRLAGPSCEVQQ
jgi:cobalt-zinc-cadmium efflux system outer membrane protein